MTSYTTNRAVCEDGGRFPTAVPAGMSRTILISERLMNCGNVPNPWFALAPRGLIFNLTPPKVNFAPPTSSVCDSQCVSTPHRAGILVALADASVRFVAYQAMFDHRAYASDPDSGVPLDANW